MPFQLPSPPPDVIGNDNVDAGTDFAFSSEVTESEKVCFMSSTKNAELRVRFRVYKTFISSAVSSSPQQTQYSLKAAA